MEYSLEFAQHMIEAAESLVRTGVGSPERQRAILYNSLVAIEISLKHLLETAGVPIRKIRARSHDLEKLLQDLDTCDVDVVIGTTRTKASASRIRSVVVDSAYENGTVGAVLTQEGASTYPNEIRYGRLPTHVSSNIVLDCAKAVHSWATGNRETIAKTPNNPLQRTCQTVTDFARGKSKIGARLPRR